MKLDEKFEDLIRNKASNNVFKRFVAWVDIEDVIDTMKNWDTRDKKEGIVEINELMKEEDEIKKAFEILKSTLNDIDEKDLEDVAKLEECVSKIEGYTFL